MKKRTTPVEIFKYPNGKEIPNKIPMWQVQTESSKDGNGYRTGVVSHGLPFLQSPDCEYISGGESMKDITAAAIARHGNFLFWGFAGSPNYMTPSAQLAFVNSIHYIKKYDGQIPILRKANKKVKTRMKVDFSVASFDKDSYLRKTKIIKLFIDKKLQEQKEAKEKKSKGEKLSKTEERVLIFNAYEPATWEEHLETQRESAICKAFNGDVNATVEYLTKNRKYYIGGEIQKGSFDEDASLLGIANSNHEILNAAIKLIETKDRVDLGFRILKRYTLKDFSTVVEWRSWYDKYKHELVFSETNGYKFYVDSYTNPQYRSEEVIGLETVSAPEPSEENPVTSAGFILPAIDGNFALVTKLRIMEGHYVYATCDDSVPFTILSLNISIPENVLSLGNKYWSSDRPYDGNENITIYKNEVTIIQRIAGDLKQPIKGVLEYQYCNKEMCSLPIKKEVIFQKANAKTFNLTINYDKAVDDTLHFSYRELNGVEKRVDITIKNGVGNYSGETCQPYWTRLSSKNFKNNGGFLLDYGDITLNFGTDSYKKEVNGSATNDEYLNYRKNFRTDLAQKYRDFSKRYVENRKKQMKGLDVNQDSLNYYRSQFMHLDKLRIMEYIRTNPDSYYSLTMARGMYKSSVEYNTIKELYDLLSSRMQQTVIGEQLLRKVKSAKATEIGTMAPDFELTDSSGESHSLSDYRGKYVFIDFYKWGCPPCEKLMHALKPIYEQFKDKEFEILGVYHRVDKGLENSKKRWGILTEKHNLSWMNLFDLDNKACEAYGIEAFPSGLLIDPDGKVISHNISVGDLKKLLEEKL